MVSVGLGAALNAAPHPVDSGDRVWLDLDCGELDLSGATDGVERHVPAEATPSWWREFFDDDYVAAWQAAGMVATDEQVAAL